jgi:C-terminal processing protease CtpA/Prc
MMRLISAASLFALVLSQALPAGAQDAPGPGTPKEETLRAFSLKVTGDGHVDLTVQEKDGEKTYSADSIDAFRKKYPDVARQYKVDGLLRPDFGEFAKPLEEWKKAFGEHGFREMDPELKKLLEHQGDLFESFRSNRPAPDVEGGKAVSPRRLGVRLAPIGETLAEQLGLSAGKGVQIVEIESGSAAEKAGLKKHDVLVKVDGKDADGLEGGRSSVLEALKKKEFDVDLLRQGKKQTVRVVSPSEK